jgi:hypothetical protein
VVPSREQNFQESYGLVVEIQILCSFEDITIEIVNFRCEFDYSFARDGNMLQFRSLPIYQFNGDFSPDFPDGFVIPPPFRPIAFYNSNS